MIQINSEQLQSNPHTRSWSIHACVYLTYHLQNSPTLALFLILIIPICARIWVLFISKFYGVVCATPHIILYNTHTYVKSKALRLGRVFRHISFSATNGFPAHMVFRHAGMYVTCAYYSTLQSQSATASPQHAFSSKKKPFLPFDELSLLQQSNDLVHPLSPLSLATVFESLPTRALTSCWYRWVCAYVVRQLTTRPKQSFFI